MDTPSNELSFQANPPEYDFTKIENPIYVYSGDSDWLADPDDVSGYLMPRISHTVVVSAPFPTPEEVLSDNMKFPIRWWNL